MWSTLLVALLISSLFIIATSGASSATSTGSEVSATSGSNRFIVWADTASGNAEILFRRSVDGGANWKPAINLSNNPGPSLVPQIEVSGPNVYVAWIQRNADGTSTDMFFRRSTDNGATWGKKINISLSDDVTGFHQIHTFKSSKLAVSGSNVYLTWAENDGEIYFRRSTDSGATWKPIVNLSANASLSRLPTISASGTGVFVAWTNGQEILFRRSIDDGITWGTKINISMDDSGKSICPQIAASGSNVYAAWEKSTNGADCAKSPEEIIFRRSTDSGATWKPIVNLSNTPEGSGLQQIAASGSNVYVVWSDGLPEPKADDEGSDIFFRRSTDNGATWKPRVQLVNNPGPSTNAQLAVSGTHVYIVWHQANDINADQSLSDAFFRRSTDNGATWKPVKNLSSNGHSIFPVIAVAGSSVYSAWISNGDVYLQRSTNDGATWSAAVNLSNSGGTGDPRIGGPEIGS